MKYGVFQRFGENPELYPRRKGHPGLDFDTPMRSELYAACDGIVTAAAYREAGGYGREVFIQCGMYSVIYGHLSRIDVAVGQHVKRSDLIGLSGGDPNDSDKLDGFSSGPHLHFEVRDTSKPWDNAVDPEIWLATDLDGDTQPAPEVSTPEIPDNSDTVDSITVTTDYINLRLRPNTNADNEPIGKVLYGMDLTKAGPPLAGTGKVISWQPIIVYVATGVTENGITEEYTE
jgi:hypothetical protein